MKHFKTLRERESSLQSNTRRLTDLAAALYILFDTVPDEN
jgi:hypothetical protein